MALSFHIDASGLATEVKNRIAQSCTRAEHVVAVQVMKDTEPFVPALTKSLVNRTRVVGNTIIYPNPSRYLFYGKLMVDPETGSAWAKEGATKVVTDKDLVFNQTVHPQAQSHWFEASKAQNLGNWIRVAGKAVQRGL